MREWITCGRPTPQPWPYWSTRPDDGLGAVDHHRDRERDHPGDRPDQRYRGKNYIFVSWSDGGARQHNITVPSTPATYTATSRRVK